MKTAEEIKEIYFGFYDQLIDPYCSEAKENFNPQISSKPLSLQQALVDGFDWGDRNDYWKEVFHGLSRYLKTGKILKPDMVNHPQHYGGDTVYEYFKVAEAWGWHKRAYLWNAGKYMKRTGEKDKSKEIEDLEKAIVYLNKEIELLRNGN